MLGPIFDYVTEALGVDALLDGIADQIKALLPDADFLEPLIEEVDALLADLESFIGGSFGIDDLTLEIDERLFGLTLGNALRRVLLSSLQGAAITSIKIENVLHEFSSLAGVREDVTDIVLNVKQIALKMEGEGPKRLQLSATGPATVKAGDIMVSGDIKVMNPDHVICHLDDGATLNMELVADTGKGYVPATANRPADAPIGLIPVDSLYSPVRQVAYKVDNARIGQELDYDKLSLTVDTDGTVTPEDAVAYAARILQDLSLIHI